MSVLSHSPVTDGVTSMSPSIDNWHMVEGACGMQAHNRHEVFGFFAAALPHRDHLESQPRMQRQGMVPDLMVAVRDGAVEDRECLSEIKTLHYGSTMYPGPRHRCDGVLRRAATFHGDYRHYVTKAKRSDRELCLTPSHQQGPV